MWMSSIRHELTDAEWFRTALPRRRGPERKDDRLVINGILWVLRTGAPWPPRTVRTVHDLLQSLQPLEQGWGVCCLYKGITTLEGKLQAKWRSSAVRAHKHRSDRAGCRSQSRGTDHQNPCRGQPLALHITPGQQAGHAPRLPEDLEAGTTVIADKAYDTDASAYRRSRGGRGDPRPAERSNARWTETSTPSATSWSVFSVKECRRVATRYDKLSRNFLSSIYLTVIRYFLKGKNLIESTP